MFVLKISGSTHEIPLLGLYSCMYRKCKEVGLSLEY